MWDMSCLSQHTLARDLCLPSPSLFRGVPLTPCDQCSENTVTHWLGASGGPLSRGSSGVKVPPREQGPGP